MGSFADRYVRIMADYCSEGVWDSEGCGGSVDDLPLSEELKQAILAWAKWYSRDCEDGMPNPRPFDRAAFSAHGLALARRVKAELPEWTVVYFDEERLANTPKGADRAEFEYQIR